MKVINCMKHAATLSINGEFVTLPPSGVEAVLKQSNVSAGTFDVNGLEMPATRSTRSELLGLPDPVEGTVFYVNAMVFGAAVAEGRTDVIMGDSGASALRWTPADVEAGLCPPNLKGLVRAITTIVVP